MHLLVSHGVTVPAGYDIHGRADNEPETGRKRGIATRFAPETLPWFTSVTLTC